MVKPLVLSGSRGVIRADDAGGPARGARARERACWRRPTCASCATRRPTPILIEGYVDGDEFAVEGVMDRGRLHVLAIFDKPDPLDGPYFEETIYVTPTARTDAHATS